MRLCASLFRGVAAPLGCVICLQLGDVAVFFTLCAVLSERARWGWYHYPRSVSHGSETLRGQGVERHTLPLLGLGRGHSRKTQRACGTAMRLCASLSRGVAAPLGCVILFRFCRNCGLYILRSGLSACARHGWYHYPQRALRAAETPDGRLSKRLICRFLRSGRRSSPHDSYFLANTQNFLLAVPVANAFALWYDKFDKLELVISASIFRVLPESNTGQGYVLDKKHKRSISASIYHVFRCIAE